MKQADLNRAVAAVTGETVGTIADMGFSLAHPEHADYDPEPFAAFDELEAKFIDWDQVDAQRHVPLVLQPAA